MLSLRLLRPGTCPGARLPPPSGSVFEQRVTAPAGHLLCVRDRKPSMHRKVQVRVYVLVRRCLVAYLALAAIYRHACGTARKEGEQCEKEPTCAWSDAGRVCGMLSRSVPISQDLMSIVILSYISNKKINRGHGRLLDCHRRGADVLEAEAQEASRKN